MLAIPSSEPGNGPRISIMTYNTLAQALVSRERYPTSGTALRWANRSKVLFEEIGNYSPDILCLQEVDVSTWGTAWKPKLQEQGYHAVFHASRQKKHGIAIAFKSGKFACSLHMLVDYDNEITEGMERSKITDNVGLFVYLSFTPEFLEGSSAPSKKGVIIGTTHLYWHAFASFERTRQTYILLKLCKQFIRNTKVLFGSDLTFYTYVAGDFNSQPFDAAYLSITEKPIEYKGITKNALGRSIAHDWYGNTSCVNESPDPENFDFTDETLKQISNIQALHNSVNLRAVSLYSIAYRHVHPENSGLDNDKNEPLFSNWTDTWKGLLDYICVLCEWENTDNTAVDSLLEFTKASSMRLLSLLRIPAKNEMCSDAGLPQPCMYPSDHLCMMAEMELL
ncbi:Endonuclease/exonuclease/phosphatase [Metschnikowia bicuspidata var. bicuspidata NRRL YB-4993]|uniref:Endonuclease/exonuclease/phosphatase n=1 Tax=Metschnikowia bicuspidata var. bicuspidata NRRL YB-4993 TaxID=869754 RepID=A0A1A0H6A5_9ASCO|nr:Endonuclease/exonuclease/phosphatase [Metschnikowia bicuspidata var. bicuspidata NRRL YB-4993]OBA19619.1 Endonuclease/exonuclease/phosphatase [Metschnikowia bicuspidata var. bicuspidata NRRL YB-4993]